MNKDRDERIEAGVREIVDACMRMFSDEGAATRRAPIPRWRGKPIDDMTDSEFAEYEAVAMGKAPPTPSDAPPLWAYKMVDDAGQFLIQDVVRDAFARLLVRVRDDALREAANQMQGMTLNEQMNPYDSARMTAEQFKRNILALVGKEPR